MQAPVLDEGAVFAADIPQAVSIAQRLRTGQVAINGGRFNAKAPFGGFKMSGLGRELGPDAPEAFTETKNVFIATDE